VHLQPALSACGWSAALGAHGARGPWPAAGVGKPMWGAKVTNTGKYLLKPDLVKATGSSWGRGGRAPFDWRV